jgi:hypothetical protein
VCRWSDRSSVPEHTGPVLFSVGHGTWQPPGTAALKNGTDRIVLRAVSDAETAEWS